MVWGAARRYAFLASDPFPSGSTATSMLCSCASWWRRALCAIRRRRLVLWLMAPLAALWGAVTGAKLGAAVGGALLAVPAYLLGRRLGGGRCLGVLAAVLAATSAESFYLSAEFVKNGVALTIALSYLAALAWALERPTWRRLAWAAAWLVAAALAHKTALAFALLVSAWPLVRAARGRVAAWQQLAALGGVAAVVVVAARWRPHRFVAARDLALVTEAWTARADWSLAVLRLPAVALHFQREVAIGGALALAAIGLAIARRGDCTLLVGPVALAVVCAVPWLDVTGSARARVSPAPARVRTAGGDRAVGGRRGDNARAASCPSGARARLQRGAVVGSAVRRR